MEKEELFDKIGTFLINQGARMVAIFGSYARGDATPNSDIDVLVSFSDEKSLLDIVKMERELSEMLHISVDLVTEKSLSPYLVESIKQEMEVIVS